METIGKDIVLLLAGGALGWLGNWVFARRSSGETRELRDMLTMLLHHEGIPVPGEQASVAELRQAVQRVLSGTIQPTGSLTTQVIRGSTAPDDA